MRQFCFSERGSWPLKREARVFGVAPRRVTNTYTNGFLTKVAQGATNYASSISYHTNATVNRVTYGNSVWVDHAKDGNDMARPSRISLGNATSSWDTGSYGYDGAGNIITMTGTSTTDTFVYDIISRIKEARQTVGGVLKTQAYAYDSFGNLSTITTNGTPRTLAVDALTNRISGSGYDAAGSMTSWGSGGTTYSYAYYPTNEMKQMVGDGRTTLFGYSADGERVGSYDSVAGGITYVLRGLDNTPLRQYREYNGGWTWQKDWVYRDGLLLATEDSTGTKYVHLDHLGTPRRITNSSRAIIASHDYYPFGEEITSSSQDTEALKFTGHERDLRDPTKTTDDLDYMHARYYNPWLGRFLSTDPIGGTPDASQSWNRYSYVLNNPLAFVDPNGEQTYVVVHGRGYTDTDLRGHNVGDLFRHAAETRAAEIRASSEFDSANDAVVVVAAGNETEFADAVNADYPSGALKSIDVFSHGYEGGINFGEGGIGDSAKRMDIMEVNQLNPTMAPGASAHLYGCRTGLGSPSMAQAMANQLGVPVSGPTGPTWFTNPNPTPENPAVHQVPQGGQVVTYTPQRPEEDAVP